MKEYNQKVTLTIPGNAGGVTFLAQLIKKAAQNEVVIIEMDYLEQTNRGLFVPSLIKYKATFQGTEENLAIMDDIAQDLVVMHNQ